MGTIKKIFILHGWTRSTGKWNPFVELLKRKGIEVNLLKIPGLTQKIDKVWQINDYVEWLIKIIGNSNGGRIALNFAIKYPDKLSNLILIDSAGIYHNELSLKIKRLFFGSV